MSKAIKGIDIIRKLNKALPQNFSYNNYIVIPHLDYDDIVYEQPNKESLNQKAERFNLMLVLQLQVPSKGLIRAGYTMN